MAVVIGLTGGIASGKSTVSTILKSMGLALIDADIIAREVVNVGAEAYHQIVETFGIEVLLPDQTIDRKKLGSIIFNDEEKRVLLNQIVHPAVRKKMIKEKERYLSNGEKTVILDIPLLFESKLTKLVDRTLLVYVNSEVQLERLMKRDNLSQEDALARISSQMPLYEKINLADAIIDNNGTFEELEAQIHQLLTNWNVIEN